MLGYRKIAAGLTAEKILLIQICLVLELELEQQHVALV